MSLWFTGSIAAAYASASVGLHRLNVWRNRRAGEGFAPMARFDWDTLFEGLLPAGLEGSVVVPGPPEGGPAATLLQGTPAAAARPRHAVLCALNTGTAVDAGRFESAGFSGGEARWLTTLSLVRSQPETALRQLENDASVTASQIYLRERLFLEHRTHLLNLELNVFGAKRRLSLAMQRLGEHPALYYARAYASAQLGFLKAVLDDLARAVYFSRSPRFGRSDFYLRVVIDQPWILEHRPVLFAQCRQLLDAGTQSGRE